MKRSLNRILFVLLMISITGPPLCQALDWTRTTVVTSSMDVLLMPRVAEDDDEYPNILYTTQNSDDPDPIYWIREEAGGWTNPRAITVDDWGSALEGFSSFDFGFDDDDNLAMVASKWTGGYGEERVIYFLRDVDWSDFAATPYPGMIQATGRWQHAIDPALAIIPAYARENPPNICTVFSGHLHGDHTNHDLFWVMSAEDAVETCSSPYDVSRYVSYYYGLTTPSCTPTKTPTPSSTPTLIPSYSATPEPTSTTTPATPFPTPTSTSTPPLLPTCPPTWTPTRTPTQTPVTYTPTPTPTPTIHKWYDKHYHLAEFSPQLVVAADGEIALFGKAINMAINAPHYDSIHAFTRSSTGTWSSHSMVVEDRIYGSAYQVFGAEQVSSSSPEYAVLYSEREVGEDRILKQTLYPLSPTPEATPYSIATISDTVGAAMDVDASNQLHVVYIKASEPLVLYYRRRNANGTWTSEEQVDEIDSGHSFQSVHVCFGATSGDLHVAYLESTTGGTYTIRHVEGTEE